MTMNDPLASAVSHILNCEKVGKRECLIKPKSRLIEDVLKIMNKKNYIGAYEVIKDGRGDAIKVNLLGNINKCGAIKPRFSITIEEYDKFQKRFLPAKGFGMLIISTNKGLMTDEEAIKKNLGGKLVAYIY